MKTLRTSFLLALSLLLWTPTSLAVGSPTPPAGDVLSEEPLREDTPGQADAAGYEAPVAPAETPQDAHDTADSEASTLEEPSTPGESKGERILRTLQDAKVKTFTFVKGCLTSIQQKSSQAFHSGVARAKNAAAYAKATLNSIKERISPSPTTSVTVEEIDTNADAQATQSTNGVEKEFNEAATDKKPMQASSAIVAAGKKQAARFIALISWAASRGSATAKTMLKTLGKPFVIIKQKFSRVSPKTQAHPKFETSAAEVALDDTNAHETDGLEASQQHPVADIPVSSEIAEQLHVPIPAPAKPSLVRRIMSAPATFTKRLFARSQKNQPAQANAQQPTPQPSSLQQYLKRLRTWWEAADKRQKDSYGRFSFDNFNQGQGLASDPFSGVTQSIDPETYYAHRTVKTSPDPVTAAPVKKEAEILVAHEGGVVSTSFSRFITRITGIPECDFTTRRFLFCVLPAFLLGMHPQNSTELLGNYIKKAHSSFYGLTQEPQNTQILHLVERSQRHEKISDIELTEICNLQEDVERLAREMQHNPNGYQWDTHQLGWNAILQNNPRVSGQVNSLSNFPIVKNRLHQTHVLKELLNLKIPLVLGVCYILAHMEAYGSLWKGLSKSTLEEPSLLPLILMYLSTRFLNTGTEAAFKKLGVPDQISLGKFFRNRTIQTSSIKKLFRGLLGASVATVSFSSIYARPLSIIRQAQKEFAECSDAIGIKTGAEVPPEMRGQKYLMLDGPSSKPSNILRMLSLALVHYFAHDIKRIFPSIPDDEAWIGKLVVLYMGVVAQLTTTHAVATAPDKTYVLTAELAYLAPTTREALLQQAHSERITRTILHSYSMGTIAKNSKTPARDAMTRLQDIAKDVATNARKDDYLGQAFASRLGKNDSATSRQLKIILRTTNKNSLLQDRLAETYARYLILEAQDLTPTDKNFLLGKIGSDRSYLSAPRQGPQLPLHNENYTGLTEREENAINQFDAKAVEENLRDFIDENAFTLTQHTSIPSSDRS